MARDFARFEKGIHITGENLEGGMHLLFGSAAPGSAAQENNAEVGSVYSDVSAGYSYIKKAAGSGTDKWERIARYDDVTALKWRSEQVAVLTATAAPVEGGTIDLAAAPFTDDDTPFVAGADLSVGEHILFGHGATEVLGKISDVTGDVITITFLGFNPLAIGDAFIVKNYLPDSPDAQEAQAIVLWNGTSYIKIGDVNWDLATGINISGTYSPGAGNPTAADTIESALEKIDGNVDALNTLSGEAQGATTHSNFSGTIIPDGSTTFGALQALETDVDAIQTLTGVAAESTDLSTFTGNIIPDASNIKQALQSLETYTEAIQVAGSSLAITTAVTVDSVLVDNFQAVEWFLKISLDSDPARVVSTKLHALHDGTTSADAVNVDDAEGPKLQHGSGFNYVIAVDLNGTGAAQTMRLRISASAAVSVKFIRRAVAF